MRLAPSLFKNAIAFSILPRLADAESGFRSMNGISALAVIRDRNKQINKVQDSYSY